MVVALGCLYVGLGFEFWWGTDLNICNLEAAITRAFYIIDAWLLITKLLFYFWFILLVL